MNIAIIPARVGSKRLPGKNLIELGGKPLIVWSIEAALEAGLFDKVIVSSDSREINELSVKHGASCQGLRPRYLSSDNADTWSVVRYETELLERHQLNTVDTVTLLQPTSPLRDSADIRSAFNLLSCEIDSVISVCENDHPREFVNQLPDDHSMKGFIDVKNLKRIQEIPVSYRLNGAIYCLKRGLLSDVSCLYGSRSKAFVMDRRRSIDIDTQFDLDLARFMYEIRGK